MEWSSSDPAVAAVSATGLATGLAPGVTNIRATAQSVSGTGVLTVGPPSQGLVWSVDFNLAPLAMLEGVWGSSGSDVFAVGTGGSILHYDGTSWSRMESDAGEALSAVWGSAPNDVYAVGYGIVLHFDGSA